MIVKLNNPLMGTETRLLKKKHFLKKDQQVKLNNPLMGTETFLLVILDLFPRFVAVKLNNPLMGTETTPPLPALLLVPIDIVLN